MTHVRLRGEANGSAGTLTGTVIRRILVANRGEIARRIFRTCHEMSIETVAVHSSPDAGEPHVGEADRAVALPGSTPAETYLDVEGVLAAAKESEADAIHPGYGFLAENPEFARRVMAEGLTWIGPPAQAIETMGSKLASKEVALVAGVPILPSTDLAGLPAKEILEAAGDLGYPILVKASAGGGGKGMRIVTDPAELDGAIAGARREAASSFGDDTVFLEKYLRRARHIEIQVMADLHGHIVSLFERECSIQRRHQKIIEEAPAPTVDPDLRREMGETAIRLARAVDYVGAGTVEFLVEGGEFYFLEMNTRLQVEHPVTEMVTGLDLVRLQIEIASGERLTVTPSISGHAVEARLYAEDPAHDFLPVTGKIHLIDFGAGEGLRVDSGVESGSVVSAFYDPMLAKVIAHGPTREEAIGVLASKLRAAVIHGPVTNRDLLVRVLEHPEFRSGQIDTSFLDRHDPAEMARPLLTEPTERLAAVVAALADHAEEKSRSRVLATIPPGWRNLRGHFEERRYRGASGDHPIRYSLSPTIRVDGVDDLEVTTHDADLVEMTVQGTTHRFRVARYEETRYVDTEAGSTRLDTIPRFPEPTAAEAPGSLHAPMPGRVTRIEIELGQEVSEGQTLLVLEAMKMEHTIRAPYSGRITRVDCESGDQVEAGATLVVVEKLDPSSTSG